MKICYVEKAFSEEKQRIIQHSDRIMTDYAQQGFDLTLRQLYYVFVAKDLFPAHWTWRLVGDHKWVRDPNGTKNADPNYTALGDIIADARLAGLIDWDHIVDRTRNLQERSHWSHPAHVVQAAADSYSIDLWENQPNYVEVWVEKDALLGILAAACGPLDVPYFSCRGYTSLSEIHVAAQRLKQRVQNGKQTYIIHLGDHDPSGVDMSRDIAHRIRNVFGVPVNVLRAALLMKQIQQYRPPPNPAKVTDSRAKDYIAKFGSSSWELDALEPNVLMGVIRTNVERLRDPAKWGEAMSKQERGRNVLQTIRNRWAEVLTLLQQPAT